MALVPEKVEPDVATPRPSSRRRRLLVGVVLLLVAGWFGGRQAWAWYHWRTAQEAMERFDFGEALEHFERCVRVWPGSTSVRLAAARAARRGNVLDRFDEHLSACEKQGVTADTALERELLRTQQGDLPPELELPLQRLIQEDHPQAVSILEALARGYIQTFRLGGALEVFKHLIERQPDHKWAYFWRGNILEENEHEADAVIDYRRAVELDPKQTEFRIRLAAALVEFGKASDAWPYLAELLQETPDRAEVLFAAARCQRDLGDRARAMEYLDSLVKVHPEHAEGWAERGRIAGYQGDADEALRSLRRAFEIDSRSPGIGYALFNELTAQGKQDEAKKVWEVHDRTKKQFERFRKVLDKLSKDGTNVELRYELGTLCLANKSEAGALRWFSSVLLLDPAHKKTHAVLADYYQRKGDTARAAYHRQQLGE
jgi:tetratricopeptide (TPR) repeat protein